MFRFSSPRPARRPSLTPMIDVVFLLLVFFMLAARFGQDVGLALAPSGSGMQPYDGPPRLVEFGVDRLWLNGVPVAPDDLVPDLRALLPDAGALVVLRPRQGANVQDLTRLRDQLHAAGVHNLVVMEGRE
ncbi:MAG: biopolymer transporter ExbD [Rhodobacteraceae bacterium]|nr:biopolymer transporter ExbD [Paracoccaceae bacterium]